MCSKKWAKPDFNLFAGRTLMVGHIHVPVGRRELPHDERAVKHVLRGIELAGACWSLSTSLRRWA
jgi:hypothetical protein